MTEVRTRFAPSPTGHLHIGGARTALFNYLFARHHGGRFVLRIEDTDLERSTDEFTAAILDGLRWLGLEWDEGPVFQSRRSDHYRAVVAELFASGSAYWCFCTAEELAAKRTAAQAAGRNFAYDRTCRRLHRQPSAGETAVVRLAVPEEGQTVVTDIIRGDIVFDHRELDDFVLVRSDGSPMFHLVNVADDIDMRITHVLRGEDHITNTPRQVQIFRALGAATPVYGHMPLIVGQDRARLSKRHGATSLLAYRDMGFLPEATLNYLARLGWAHGDQEIFTVPELVAAFEAEAIHKAAAAWDMEKFAWVNAQHMKLRTDAELVEAVKPFLPPDALDELGDLFMQTAVALVRERARTFVELAAALGPLVRVSVEYDAAAVEKFLGQADRARLRTLALEMEAMEIWVAPEIENAIRAFCEGEGIKLGAIAQPLRVALTGGTASPGMFEFCHVLGRARTLTRIRTACNGVESGTLPLRP
ncbi:MAG: glutamate--tRNA ligase [Candidatus Binatia bacterium]